jgi:hypothetical protein
MRMVFLREWVVVLRKPGKLESWKAANGYGAPLWASVRVAFRSGVRAFCVGGFPRAAPRVLAAFRIFRDLIRNAVILSSLAGCTASADGDANLAADADIEPDRVDEPF